jgi:hypothetical protein
MPRKDWRAFEYPIEIRMPLSRMVSNLERIAFQYPFVKVAERSNGWARFLGQPAVGGIKPRYGEPYGMEVFSGERFVVVPGQNYEITGYPQLGDKLYFLNAETKEALDYVKQAAPVPLVQVDINEVIPLAGNYLAYFFVPPCVKRFSMWLVFNAVSLFTAYCSNQDESVDYIPGGPGITTLAWLNSGALNAASYLSEVNFESIAGHSPGRWSRLQIHNDNPVATIQLNSIQIKYQQ